MNKECAVALSGAEFIDVTFKVLPDDLRSYLECRDQEESEQASGHQIGYYHEGFKRKIYQRGEVGWCCGGTVSHKYSMV